MHWKHYNAKTEKKNRKTETETQNKKKKTEKTETENKNSVPVRDFPPNSVGLPVFRVQVFWSGRPHNNVLHVPPSDVLVNLKKKKKKKKTLKATNGYSRAGNEPIFETENKKFATYFPDSRGMHDLH